VRHGHVAAQRHDHVRGDEHVIQRLVRPGLEGAGLGEYDLARLEVRSPRRGVQVAVVAYHALAPEQNAPSSNGNALGVEIEPGEVEGDGVGCMI